MFVYNLTIQVDNKILQQWLKWQKEEYLPRIMAMNLFADIKFFELLELNDPDASTFVLQHFIESKEKYDKFINVDAPALREKYLTKWGDNIITFNTLMQIVN